MPRRCRRHLPSLKYTRPDIPVPPFPPLRNARFADGISYSRRRVLSGDAQINKPRRAQFAPAVCPAVITAYREITPRLSYFFFSLFFFFISSLLVIQTFRVGY
ncbi:hypothetical protein PUN28_018027 [Cardiocondyla obscurior]|uniref:Uncharacterized protein n=1 Tax=Cardiocondyla obscurior TaxID=286306 RepID=A0AAW2EJE1_9HYME